jgi:hypothetical protein
MLFYVNASYSVCFFYVNASHFVSVFYVNAIVQVSCLSHNVNINVFGIFMCLTQLQTSFYNINGGSSCNNSFPLTFTKISEYNFVCPFLSQGYTFFLDFKKIINFFTCFFFYNIFIFFQFA